MSVEAAFKAALETTPYPVTQKPVKGNAPIYLTFSEVLGRPDAYASNQAQRILHTMQVDIFARQPISPEFIIVAKALRAAGIRVASWGPADYETDTRWHHLPITCYYSEPTKQEE